MRRSPDRESKRRRRARHTPCTCAWGGGELHWQSRWCCLPPELQQRFGWLLLESVILQRNAPLCDAVRRVTHPIWRILDSGFPQYFSHTRMGRGWLIAGPAYVVPLHVACDYLVWQVWDLLEPIPQDGFFAACLNNCPNVAQRVSNLNYEEALRHERRLAFENEGRLFDSGGAISGGEGNV